MEALRSVFEDVKVSSETGTKARRHEGTKGIRIGDRALAFSLRAFVSPCLRA